MKKNLLVFLFFIFVWQSQANAQFRVSQEPIIEGKGPGAAYVLSESTFAVLDIRSIYWEGPNGFLTYGSSVMVADPGVYCVSIVSTTYCLSKVCTEVPVCALRKWQGIRAFVCSVPLYESRTFNPIESGKTLGFDRVLADTFQNEITLKITSLEKQQVEIAFQNAQKEVVFSEKILLEKGENQVSFDFSTPIFPTFQSVVIFDSTGNSMEKHLGFTN